MLPSLSSPPDRKTSRTALLSLRSFLSTAFLAFFLSRGSQRARARVCVCVLVCGYIVCVFLSVCPSLPPPPTLSFSPPLPQALGPDSPDPPDEALQIGVHSYLMHGVYPKVFPFWCRMFEDEDRALAAYCQQQRHVSLAELDVAPALQHGHGPAVQCLQRMERRASVYHKIGCIQDCIAEITRSGAVGADELLPVFIYVTIQSCPPHALSTLSYLNTFRCPELGHGERAYALATYESAIRFVEHEGRKVQQRRSSVQVCVLN